MRPCPQCGAQAQGDDDFCGNCGTYLGWGRDGGPGSPAPAERPAGTVEHPSELGGAGTLDDTGDSGNVPRVDPAAGDRPGSPWPAPDRPDDRPPPAPVPDAPRAVQPARPAARRPTPKAPVVTPTRDGTPCPACGTPNPPGRHFCRRCSNPLDAQPPSAPVRRKRRMRMPRWVWPAAPRWLRRVVLLAVLAGLVTGGILLYPQGGAIVAQVRDKLSTPAQVEPVHTTASAAVDGHPASAAADGLTNRYWGVPAPGDSVDFTFDHPFRLLTLVIHSGASTNREEFDRQARPSHLDVTVTRSDGQTRSLRIDLADRPGPQHTDTAISDVVRFHLVVRTAFGLSGGKHIAVGEVEFFGRG